MPDRAQRPTALAAFLECLHVIEALAPGDRHLVIEALNNLRLFSAKVLTSDEQIEDDDV